MIVFLIVLSLHMRFSKLFFEQCKSFFRCNDISFETTEKTASFCAKKQESQKMEFDHCAPVPFSWLPAISPRIEKTPNDNYV